MNLHSNYSFLFDQVISKMSGKLDSYKILDYGCGKGSLVEAGLAKHIDFYGVEMFSHGSGVGIKNEIDGKGLLGERIREIVDEKIPYPDQYFDLVVSNQVFEHIPDIEPVLAEISRVTKPGGEFLCLMPYQGAYMEGHCKIPFAHRFQPESRLQYYWLYAFKIFGFGRRKKEKNPDIWARYWSTWLKENTFYRTYQDINVLFKKYYSSVDYIEEDYLKYRLSLINKKRLSFFATLAIVKPFSRWFVRKYGSLVILSKKSSE